VHHDSHHIHYFAALHLLRTFCRRAPRLIVILPCFLPITLSPTSAKQTLLGPGQSVALSLSRYETFPASEPSWWQAGLRMGRISLRGRRSDRSRSASTIKTAYIRYPSLRYNQLRRLRTCTYLLRKALALSSSLAVRRVTRLQQVPIVTCCASKRHRCLTPSIIPSSHPIQFALTLNIITTSSPHHITPLPRILVRVPIYSGTVQYTHKDPPKNPDPTDRPMHLTCIIEKCIIQSLHPIHPYKHSCRPYMYVRTSPASL
jgi:hypothetical protein